MSRKIAKEGKSKVAYETRIRKMEFDIGKYVYDESGDGIPTRSAYIWVELDAMPTHPHVTILNKHKVPNFTFKGSEPQTILDIADLLTQAVESVKEFDAYIAKHDEIHD
jgi:hypothetical protein